MVILKNETFTDESVISFALEQPSHSLNLTRLDGDEEIWLLYEPTIFQDGYFQVQASIEMTYSPVESNENDQAAEEDEEQQLEETLPEDNEEVEDPVD